MTKIPFTVSARAARLIGRENVATSQGAITELVKNTYDADARVCVIVFAPSKSRTPDEITEREFNQLVSVLPTAKTFYPASEEGRRLKADVTDADREGLARAFARIPELWIIDNGHGMATQIIADRWMVIGTDTKEYDGVSEGGRVMTGAKGIGRFALDRLGQESELFSAEENAATLAHWIVDWGAFEGRGKIITDVEAILEEETDTLADVYARHGLAEILPKTLPERDGAQGASITFDKGTAVRISALHDLWDERDSLRLKETLEALLPPRDRGGFDIFIHDFRAVAQSGFIDNLSPDQFDYRLNAEVRADGSVKVKLERQEIDVSKITPTAFTLPGMDADGFHKADFDEGSYTYETTLRAVLKLPEKAPLDDYLAIGPLDFTLYFFKLANPTASTLKRFPQKKFDVTKRKAWLKASGGVRLYRDGFRVRPYGEPNSQGSDWLLLGERVARNPAQASRPGWRVPPQQLAGTIHITKEDNPALADQSNREGIMNERAFATFRSIVLGLIGEFERDRAHIYSQFDKAYDLDHPEETQVAEGIALATQILENGLTPPELADVDANSQLPLDLQAPHDLPSPDDAPAPATAGSEARDLAAKAVSMALTVQGLTRKKAELEENAQTLMGMATLGTVLVSFTHELKQIKANMSLRRQRMTNALNRVVDSEKLSGVSDLVNPYTIVDRWAREDEKVSRWVDFALTAVSPIKRRRKSIDLPAYFNDLQDYWREFLASKSAHLHIDCTSNSARVFGHEIDLDSVFYNLIINSVEAFTRPSEHTQRNIAMTVVVDDGMINIVYRDSGPGLSTSLRPEQDIFDFGISSKPNDEAGQPTGTGIGMWIVQTIIQDWGGDVQLDSEIGQPGFGLSMTLPVYSGGAVPK